MTNLEMIIKNAFKTLLLLVSIVYLFPIFYNSNLLAQEDLEYEIFLNPTTNECTKYFKGVDCIECRFDPPLGDDWSKERDIDFCPQNYVEIKLPHECTPKKTTQCCTLDATEYQGDCDDLVIKGVERKCAFVEDVTQCETLPEGWERPEEGDDWQIVCPSEGYEWVDGTIDCYGEVVSLDDDLTVNTLYLEEDDENRKIIVVTTLFLLFGFITLWLLNKNRDKAK